MAKEKKYKNYFDWCFNSNGSVVLWIILLIVLSFFFGFWGAISAVVLHYIIWISSNKKDSSKKIKKQKSKQQHKKENAIALYFIVFLIGLFVYVVSGFSGKAFLIWLLIGFALIYWYQRNGKNQTIYKGGREEH